MAKQTSAQSRSKQQARCPDCAEPLGAGTAHICPVACYYVPARGDPPETTCPYCSTTFQTSAGHVCPELVRMTLPQQ
jgi:hypothetical protein